MVRPKREIPTVQISVRVEQSLADRIDRVVELLKRVNVGGLGSRVDAVRAALNLGVGALEQELVEKLRTPESATAPKRVAKKR